MRFRHVVRRKDNIEIKTVWRLMMDGKSRGRQWMRMRDIVRRDMDVVHILEKEVMDRT